MVDHKLYKKNMSTWFSYFLVFIKFRIFLNNFSFSLNNKAHRSYMCLFTLASQMAEPLWFLMETMVKYILRQKVRILMHLVFVRGTTLLLNVTKVLQ